MKDVVVEILSETFFKVGEGSLTGNVDVIDAGIEAIGSSPVRITKCINEGFHVGKLVEIAEQIQQEYADGIISKTNETITMGDERSNEGKVDQRGNEVGEPPTDAAVGVDNDVAPLVAIAGQ